MTHEEAVEQTMRAKADGELRTLAFDNPFTTAEYREAARVELRRRRLDTLPINPRMAGGGD